MARILLVEDDAATAEMYRVLLTKAGHHVTLAGDGFEGVEAATAGNEPPDLVLTDILMPHRDGEELIDSFDAFSPDTPVVVVTAVNDPARLARLRAMPNVRQVLCKPVELGDLRAAIAAALS